MSKAICVAVVALAAAAAGPSLAEDDPPTATAPVSTNVADQIAAYLRDSPILKLPTTEATATAMSPAAPAPRRPHGEVAVAVGSHGYRSIYARTDLPVGETGTLSLAVAQGRGGYPGPRILAPGRLCRTPLNIDAAAEPEAAAYCAPAAPAR